MTANLDKLSIIIQKLSSPSFMKNNITKTDDLQKLAQLSRDFATALASECTSQKDNWPLIAKFPEAGETEIDAIELLTYNKKPKEENVVEKLVDKKEASTTNLRNLPRNFSCESCQDRLFPVKQFFRVGKIPLLFLVSNGVLKSSKHSPLARDRSLNLVFSNENENELFGRILSSLSHKWSDFYFQEFPACYFNSNTSTMEDWKRRAQNCWKHVEHTITENKIKKLVLCGNAALAFLGIKEAKEKSQSMKSFLTPIEAKKTPGHSHPESIECLVIRSPSAILSLEKKRKEAKDKNIHSELLSQEKEIKTNILSSLKSFIASNSH